MRFFKNCIVCTHWLGLNPLASEFQPGLWVCGRRCWGTAASAVEHGLDFIYLPL